MSFAASSLVLPKTLALSKSLVSLSSAPSSPLLKLSLSTSFLLSRRGLSLETPPSRFALNVAVSSEFQQEEGEEEGSDDVDQRSFAPDLKLFVGNLPFNVDSSVLAGLFQQAGNVQMVEVIYDKITQRSRGFGFVTMSTPEEVEAAAQQFNGYELEGRPLRVNFGPPPARRENQDVGRGGSRDRGGFADSNRVYVGNLSWGVDDSALGTLFSEQGNVVEAKVVYDRESGRSRGFGFVTYRSAEEVSSAIESLDGTDLDGRPIRVSVAESRPRRQF